MAKMVLKFGWSPGTLEDMPVPSVDGFKISREKVWSANAKRTSSALFQGTLIAEKVTLDMAFPANLTPEQITKLEKYVCPSESDLSKNPSHKYCYIRFRNEKGETDETKQFYFGNPTFDAHVFLNGKFLWSSIQIRAVER